ncbi:NAC domain-containing protein 96 [Quercus suber]|uniref:Nac domain-containing protein 89 n=1 Tax=Quercus suber TaxID=58331 RepID=A0AAW0KPI7_QUESU|nr:NAC domain-containing protein 96-like [Quercus suber]POF26751.1 nac domain-containing protein 89 [Quercus suber]
MGFSPSPRSKIVGFKFDPSDQELLSYFLYNKVTGKSLDFYRGFISDFDLYGPNQPDQIWDLFGGSFLRQDEDLFFFTTLSFKGKGKAKGSRGSRISRTISSGGTWSNEGSKVIYDAHSSLPIGIKRWFHYENSQSPQNGCWIMYEFTLDVEGSSLRLPSSDQAVVASSVLCRLRRNDQAKTTSRKRKVQPQPLPQQDCPRKKQRAAEHATTTDASDDTLLPLIPISNQHSVVHIDAIASPAAATASEQALPPMVTISDPVSESEFGHGIFNTDFDDEDFCFDDLDQFLNEFLGDLTDCDDSTPLL